MHARAALRTGLCALTLLIAGCQTVHTTNAGAVGVTRSQSMANFVSEADLRATAVQNYQQTLAGGQKAGKLNDDPALTRRVRAISSRLIAQTAYFRADAPKWPWEVNVMDSPELNAWCMPGGKVMVYSGLVKQLQLTDDELAAVIGHELAHALREHARERISREYGQNLLLTVGMVALGVSGPAAQLGDMLGKVTFSLPHGRTQETEADGMGLELMARAGYDPAAAVNVWRKMAKVQQSQQAEFLSTHPSSSTRIAELQALLPKVTPLYEAAQRKG